MQIKNLILYGKNGQKRIIEFQIGKVNIITGRSKSGKKAIGDIINYCFGGDSCNIAEGIIRENVDWYALLLDNNKEEIFIARRNPTSNRATTNECFIDIGEKIVIPTSNDFVSNTNSEGIEQALSARIGISENIYIPPATSTRKAISANIRHALLYCFQTQDEIATKNFLFHRQSEDFMPQIIKDTILYFLGVVNENSIIMENQKKI